MGKIFGMILAVLAMFSLYSPAMAMEVFKGYLTGSECATHSMLCPLDHKDGGKEAVVLLTEDGKTIYGLKGLERKYLLQHFNHLVQVEGKLNGGVIDVEKISHISVGKDGGSLPGGKGEK